MTAQIPNDLKPVYWKDSQCWYPAGNKRVEAGKTTYTCFQDAKARRLVMFPGTSDGSQRAVEFCNQVRRDGLPEGIVLIDNVELTN